MIKAEEINVEKVKEGLSLGTPVIRKKREELVNGGYEEFPHLQFLVLNNCSNPVKDIDCELKYFSKEGDYLGQDDDFNFKQVDSGESISLSVLLEVPENYSYAELTVTGEDYGFKEKYDFMIRMGILGLILLLAYLFNSH